MINEKGLMIQLPEAPTEDDLAQDWSLSPEDLNEIKRYRNEDTKLNFALQLCALRKYGRFLKSLKVPLKIANHLYTQIGIPPVLLSPQISINEDTIYDHEARLRMYCSFESFSYRHIAQLQDHLITLANEGTDRESLYQSAHIYLFDRRITPPGFSVLTRIANSAYNQAETIIYDEIAERISEPLRKKIDLLLQVDESGSGTSPLIRYRGYPKIPRPDHILEYLDRFEKLKMTEKIEISQ